MLMVILPKLPSFWAQPVPAIVMAVMQAPAAAPIGTWSPHHRPGLRNVYAHCAQVSPGSHCIQWWHQSARCSTLRALYSRACVGEKRAAWPEGSRPAAAAERCYLVRRRSGDVTQGCKPWQLSIETLLNGCTTQLTIVWWKKGFTFCKQIHRQKPVSLKRVPIGKANCRTAASSWHVTWRCDVM